MLEKEIEVFKNYVNNYDLNDPKISRKYYHSFRVMNYCVEIAKSLNLNEEEINLAGLIRLIARYWQV